MHAPTIYPDAHWLLPAQGPASKPVELERWSKLEAAGERLAAEERLSASAVQGPVQGIQVVSDGDGDAIAQSTRAAKTSEDAPSGFH